MLIRNAAAIMTGLPGNQARAQGSDIRISSEGRIEAIGSLVPQPDERVVDATDCVVYPGWVNTHHHLAQSVLKGVPQGINLPLLSWLESVPYRYRTRFDPELLSLAAEIGIAELMLAGCTTLADHHYVYWQGMDYDPAKILFDLAGRYGMRFVLCRGGATLKRPFEPADAPEPENLDLILQDIERLARQYHDPGPEALRRVVMAPPTPNSTRPDRSNQSMPERTRSFGTPPAAQVTSSPALKTIVSTFIPDSRGRCPEHLQRD